MRWRGPHVIYCDQMRGSELVVFFNSFSLKNIKYIGHTQRQRVFLQNLNGYLKTQGTLFNHLYPICSRLNDAKTFVSFAFILKAIAGSAYVYLNFTLGIPLDLWTG